MFRKFILATAAAAVVAASSLTVTSAAEAASKRDRIIAGAAIGVAAVLLGAEINAGHKGKGFRNHGKSGGKGKQRHSFRTHCEDVPIFGGNGGRRVVGFHRVCD